jgi:hypothetical protein
MKVTENVKEPVFVAGSKGGRRVVLRIGHPRRGETRIAVLELSETRRLTYALLSEAERMDEIYGA